MSKAVETHNMAVFCDFENVALGVQDARYAEFDINKVLEKLLLKGKSALTDAELIAILIGSGTPSISAVDLSKHILSSVNHDLSALARLTIQDLKKFKGIGEAKAISIGSATELGRR